jgi:predicted nucleotidyltransferase
MNTTLQKIIDYAVRITAPDKVILFGSMASGKITPHSDVDLLIISEHTRIKRELSNMIRAFCRDFSLKTDVLIYSQSDLEREQQKPNSFLGAVCKDGKLVYSKNKMDTKKTGIGVS